MEVTKSNSLLVFWLYIVLEFRQIRSPKIEMVFVTVTNTHTYTYVYIYVTA